MCSHTNIFNKGDGEDSIIDGGGDDVLRFGEGIKLENVIARRVEETGYSDRYHNLELSLRNSSDKVTIRGYFGFYSGGVFGKGFRETPEHMMEKFIFADGTIWNQETIYNMMHNRNGTDEDDNISAYDDGAVVYRGLAGNDKLTGGPADDILYGDEGDDFLYGNAGNDTLVGGPGDDYLSGGEGDDIYIFNRGDGEDRIVEGGGVDIVRFGEGVRPEDVTVRRVSESHGYSSDYSLELSIEGTGDKLTIEKQFGYYSGSVFSSGFKETPERAVEKFAFTDGTVWTQDTIYRMIHKIVGTGENNTITAFDNGSVEYYGLAGDDSLDGGAGNDYLDGSDGADSISGNSGDDTLIGGPGDDRLYGGSGNDVYVFNRGDGADYIYDSGGDSDELHFEYSHDELIFERIRGSGYFSPDLLQIRAPGTGDSVKIDYWYRNGSSSKIETFKSSDGYQITHTQVENLIQAMSTLQQNSGLTWEQALSTQPSQTHSILQEYWTVPGV